MDPTGAAPATAEKKDAEKKAIGPSGVVEPMSTPAATADTRDDSDPDEDDLDDLDDMLEDFSTIKLDSTKTADAATKSSAPAPVKPDGALNPEDLTEEDFAQQLQDGMASLLGELGQSPEMQAEFENLFKGMAPAAAGEADATGAGSSGTAGENVSFQDTIRRTMERMQSSGDQATAAAAQGGADDFMSELLKQMSSGELGGEGGEEEFSKMLMGMMEQLTNKEILYEPMKELHDKFPEWLEKNRDKTPADDVKRFEEQHRVVNEIVARFEADTYSDEKAADREYIVERMQKMQELGSPPSDLVGDLDTAQEAFAGADEQCNPQ